MLRGLEEAVQPVLHEEISAVEAGGQRSAVRGAEIDVGRVAGDDLGAVDVEQKAATLVLAENLGHEAGNGGVVFTIEWQGVGIREGTGYVAIGINILAM